MESVLDLARAGQTRLSDLRRELHRWPELAWQEHRTADLIERELDRIGIAHRRIGDTGVLGTVRGEGPGDGAVALRADIDALPIQELNEVPYRSERDGVMHACGHDAHTVCLLGAAGILAEKRDRFGGEVRLLFQPAEETGGGAVSLIRGGALEGVRRAFGLHVAPELPLGTVGVKTGLNNAAVDRFRILVHGRSAHVSTPHLGADALYAASQIVVAIQGIVARRTSPIEPVILGIGTFRSGTTYNAVAEEAELEGTTRTISQEQRAWARERIDETARHVAAVSGAEAEVLWTDVCPPVINDAVACEETAAAVRALDPGLIVKEDRPLSLGGDDFAEYQREVPACYAYLGTSDASRPGTCVGIHDGRFDLDERALSIGAGLYAQTALLWLGGGT